MRVGRVAGAWTMIPLSLSLSLSLSVVVGRGRGRVAAGAVAAEQGVRPAFPPELTVARGGCLLRRGPAARAG